MILGSGPRGSEARQELKVVGSKAAGTAEIPTGPIPLGNLVEKAEGLSHTCWAAEIYVYSSFPCVVS